MCVFCHCCDAEVAEDATQILAEKCPQGGRWPIFGDKDSFRTVLKADLATEYKVGSTKIDDKIIANPCTSGTTLGPNTRVKVIWKRIAQNPTPSPHSHKMPAPAKVAMVYGDLDPTLTESTERRRTTQRQQHQSVLSPLS